MGAGGRLRLGAPGERAGLGYRHAPADPAPDVPARADAHRNATAYLDAILSGDLHALAAEDADAWVSSGLRERLRVRAGSPARAPRAGAAARAAERR